MERRHREEPPVTESGAVGIEAPKERASGTTKSTVDLSAEEPTDEQVWQSYVELQDGTANRRRSIENARREQREREEEWVEYCKQSGSPLPTHMEHLRPRLKDFGY